MIADGSGVSMAPTSLAATSVAVWPSEGAHISEDYAMDYAAPALTSGVTHETVMAPTPMEDEAESNEVMMEEYGVEKEAGKPVGDYEYQTDGEMIDAAATDVSQVDAASYEGSTNPDERDGPIVGAKWHAVEAVQETTDDTGDSVAAQVADVQSDPSFNRVDHDNNIAAASEDTGHERQLQDVTGTKNEHDSDVLATIRDDALQAEQYPTVNQSAADLTEHLRSDQALPQTLAQGELLNGRHEVGQEQEEGEQDSVGKEKDEEEEKGEKSYDQDQWKADEAGHNNEAEAETEHFQKSLAAPALDDIDEEAPPAAPPIRVTFNGQDFVIFPRTEPPSFTAAEPNGGTEQDLQAPILAVDTKVYHEPLESLFEALRVQESLGDFLDEGTELSIVFEGLDVSAREDDVYVREVTLEDMARLHVGLGRTSSLHISVSEGRRFITRYNELATRVSRILESQTAVDKAEVSSNAKPDREGSPQDEVDREENYSEGSDALQQTDDVVSLKVGTNEAPRIEEDDTQNFEEEAEYEEEEEQTFVTVDNGEAEREQDVEDTVDAAAEDPSSFTGEDADDGDQSTTRTDQQDVGDDGDAYAEEGIDDDDYGVGDEEDAQNEEGRQEPTTADAIVALPGGGDERTEDPYQEVDEVPTDGLAAESQISGLLEKEPASLGTHKRPLSFDAGEEQYEEAENEDEVVVADAKRVRYDAPIEGA